MKIKPMEVEFIKMNGTVFNSDEDRLFLDVFTERVKLKVDKGFTVTGEALVLRQPNVDESGNILSISMYALIGVTRTNAFDVPNRKLKVRKS